MQNQYGGGASDYRMNQDPWAAQADAYQQQELAGVMPYMSKVYGWMFLGLLYTAGISLASFQFEAVRELLFRPMVVYGAVGAQFLIIFLLWPMVQRKASVPLAMISYFVYATVMGILCAVSVQVYAQIDPGAIAVALAATGGMFGVMTLVGLTTKKDLTGIGALCGMAFIGIIIGFVVNMFLGSSQLDFIISIVAVLALVGFTAYDTQMAKREAQALGGLVGSKQATSVAIFRAMSIYANVVLLFLYLLRLLGGRD